MKGCMVLSLLIAMLIPIGYVVSGSPAAERETVNMVKKLVQLLEVADLKRVNEERNKELRRKLDDADSVDKYMRLSGGSKATEGRLEIKLSFDWHTVCDDAWDDEQTLVVCRELGFPTNNVRFTSAHEEERFGKGVGPIWSNILHCWGYELSIHDCENDMRYQFCEHDEDVIIFCED